MAQTISEKIFKQSMRQESKSGDFVLADIDRAIDHDITVRFALKGFREIVKKEKPEGLGPWTKSLYFLTTGASRLVKCRCEPQFSFVSFAKEQGILNYDVFEGVAIRSC